MAEEVTSKEAEVTIIQSTIGKSTLEVDLDTALAKSEKNFTKGNQ